MKYYIVDAFAEELFAGNPAGVCILDKWIDDTLLKNIAVENNLSETVFVVKNGSNYDLRYFTPDGTEIDLVGHATLASAHIMFSFYEKDANIINFSTKGGMLNVKKGTDKYEMDFPAFAIKQVTVSSQMEKTIGVKPVEAWMGRDLVCILENEDLVCNAKIDLTEAIKLDGMLLHITAKSQKYDCVSRTFGPKVGISEDPVCGTGHCHIVPIWSEKLNKKSIVANQASKRGGTLYCEKNGDRIKLSGKAKLYLEGEIYTR